MRGRLLILAGLLMLAGCQSDIPGKHERFMSPEEKVAKDDAKCRSYGLKPGTEMYTNCRMKQDEIRANYRGRVAAAAVIAAAVE